MGIVARVARGGQEVVGSVRRHEAWAPPVCFAPALRGPAALWAVLVPAPGAFGADAVKGWVA